MSSSIAAPPAPAPPAKAGRTHAPGPADPTQVIKVGARGGYLDDLYHFLIAASWARVMLLVASLYLALNTTFALLYLAGGDCVTGAAPGSFEDAFFFSVQTLATIGYGAMYPESVAAEWIMIVESIVSLVVTALATGLIFSKFARPTTRVAFSKYAVITQHDGERVLMFRAGNRRGNVIVEATVHVVAVYTTTTREGRVFYKSVDLPLVRDRQVGMTRGWTLMHRIDEASPLYGLDTAQLKQRELELYIALTGIDDVQMQTVHAMHTYTDDCIRLDHHFEDTVIPMANGEFLVDITKFDAVSADPIAGAPAALGAGAATSGSVPR